MGIRQKLAERIKSAREERGVTQQVLADTLGVSRVVVSDWETGKGSPNLDRLDVLAAFLQKPISYFFTEQTEMEGHQIKNPAFFVRAYCKTIAQLRKQELEQKRHAKSTRVQREHFESQAFLLLDQLSPEERAAIDEDELEYKILDLAGSKDESFKARMREKHSSRAFATINALPRLMDEVVLDEMDDERSFVSQMKGWLRKYGRADPKGKDFEVMAVEMVKRLNHENRHLAFRAIEFLNYVEVAILAKWGQKSPDFKFEKALQLTRQLANGAIPIDGVASDDLIREALDEMGFASEDTEERLRIIADFWRRLQEQFDGIPF